MLIELVTGGCGVTKTAAVVSRRIEMKAALMVLIDIFSFGW
jgi:hypothetical protein